MFCVWVNLLRRLVSGVFVISWMFMLRNLIWLLLRKLCCYQWIWMLRNSCWFLLQCVLMFLLCFGRECNGGGVFVILNSLLIFFVRFVLNCWWKNLSSWIFILVVLVGQCCVFIFSILVMLFWVVLVRCFMVVLICCLSVMVC